MTPSLSGPIAAYFRISNGEVADRIDDVFAADATVHDEGRTWHGIGPIATWQRAGRAKFDYRVEPLGATADGDRLVVTTRVAGNFPGSPVQLDHVFELAAGRIRMLEIG